MHRKLTYRNSSSSPFASAGSQVAMLYSVPVRGGQWLERSPKPRARHRRGGVRDARPAFAWPVAGRCAQMAY